MLERICEAYRYSKDYGTIRYDSQVMIDSFWKNHLSIMDVVQRLLSLINVQVHPLLALKTP